jgi:hypothetical protein
MLSQFDQREKYYRAARAPGEVVWPQEPLAQSRCIPSWSLLETPELYRHAQDTDIRETFRRARAAITAAA